MCQEHYVGPPSSLSPGVVCTFLIGNGTKMRFLLPQRVEDRLLFKNFYQSALDQCLRMGRVAVALWGPPIFFERCR